MKPGGKAFSVDALLERLINERAALTPPAQCNPELPVWQLAGCRRSSPAGYLRRCPLNLVFIDANVLVSARKLLTLQAFFVK